MLGIGIDSGSKRRWPPRARSASRTPPDKAEPPELYVNGGHEPPIDDLLDDPVTAAILRCDHISPAALRSLVDTMREKLKERALQRHP